MEALVRPVGPIQANAYVLRDEQRQAASIVDPGHDDPWLVEAVAGYRVDYILLTHAHMDHIGGLRMVKEATGAPVYVHPAEADWLTDPQRNGSAFAGDPIAGPGHDALLEDGMRLDFAGREIEVLHTPGHSPGGVSFLVDGICLCGDAIFRGAVGRYDLPGSDRHGLVATLRDRLLALPPETRLLPGHGPETTVAAEWRDNPLVAALLAEG